MKSLEKLIRIYGPHLVIILTVTSVYVPTLSGGFILDDWQLIKDNQFIREFHAPASYLAQEDGIVGYDDGGFHSGYYRPLVNLFYTLDYKIWGLDARGFRATNLVLHLICCLLFYRLLARFYDGPLIPLAATLLFSLHPVNTETVAWISSRNNILVSLLSLLSFEFYMLGLRRGRMLPTAISAFFFGLALLCKEFAAALLPIFALYRYIIHEPGRVNRKELASYLLFLLVLAAYFVLRSTVVEAFFVSKAGHAFWQSVFYAPFLVIYNLKLILFPYGLHSYIITYPDSAFNWQVLTGIIGLGSFAFLTYLGRTEKKLVFSLFSFLVALAPVLNIIPTSAPSLISMRWLYFPMMFFFIAGAWFLERLLRVNRAFCLCLLSLVAAYFGSYAFILNEELWHDETIFLEQEVVRFGNHYYADGLAKILHKKGEYERAKFFFEEAIKHAPTRPDNYINYAALLIDLRKHDKALANLKKAQSLPLTRSSKGALYVNKGVLYFRRNKPGKAVSNFSRAVEYCPEEPKYWTDLGAGYMLAKNYEKAVAALKQSLAIDPASFRARKLLALSYFRMGAYDEAIGVVEGIAVERRKKDRSLADLLSDAYAKRRDGHGKASKHVPRGN